MPAYATATDLAALGVRAEALSDIPAADQEASLEAASRLADSYLAAAGYSVPLATWGDDLRRAVAAIAAYDLMAVRGFAPEGVDENLRLRYEDAIRWLERVAQGRVKLIGVDLGVSAIGEVFVVTDPKRGW